ncbi:MAG: TolC family protein, partial [Anaerotignaceae bacterium]
MKRKLCLYALIVTLALSSTAYAQEETENVSQKENLYYTYTSTLKPTTNENELITVEQVTDKVKKYSASLKTSANEIDLLKNKSEGYGEQYVYSYSFSSLSNLLNSQASYKNAQISLESQNAEIEYSVLQSYVQIINSQREIQLSEKSLENAKYNLDLSKKKYELGVLAKEAYENQELEYDNLKLSHQTKIDNLETEYEALNVLMGVDLDTRYSFELPAYYEKLELPISIDTYVTANSAKANSIKIKESNVSAAQNDKNVGPLNEGAIDLYNYQTLYNKLASAELELRDQKDTVSTNMKNL